MLKIMNHANLFPVHPAFTRICRQAAYINKEIKDQSSIGFPDQYLPHEICEGDKDGIQFELE
jgi:hypothetical protein